MARTTAVMTLTLAVSVAALSQVWHVPQDVPTIQAAIDSARSGDTILVADGRYEENINFRGKDLTLGSLFLTTGDPRHITGTVIDGLRRDATVRFASGETNACRLVGMTITGGWSLSGGGISCISAGPQLSNLIVQGNEAAWRWILGWPVRSPGGGAYFSRATATLSDVVFAANTSTSIYLTDSANVTMVHVTIADNDGGVFVVAGSHLTLENSILWNKALASLGGDPADIDVQYSDVRGGWVGTGNIDVRPAFVNAPAGDYTLSDFSPCIAQGNPAFGGNADLRGAPRPQPAGSAPDMGAYENLRAVPLIGPGILFSPSNLDFGELFLGDTLRTTLYVRNPGTMDLLIFTARTDDPAFSIWPPFAAVHPDDSDSFRIAFTPTSTRPYSGTITLLSNAANGDSLTVTLQGVGLKPPIISLVVDSLVVTVGRGGTVQKTLTVLNSGPSTLILKISGGYSTTNRALQFDGATGMLTGLTTGLPTGKSDRSMELWFRRDSQPCPEGTLIGYGGWGQGAQLYELLITSDRVCFSQWGDAISGGTTILSEQWYHCAIVSRGDSVTMYVNGQVDARGYLNIATASSGQMAMGKAPSGYDDIRRLNGAIDEVRIWNYASTQAQIRSNMHRELSGKEAGLVGYWQFNEGTGTTAFDRTANANDGSLQGGVTWISSTAPLAPGWLVIGCDSATCAGLSSLDITVQFDATALDAGSYRAVLTIRSNDPVRPTLSLPVHLVVSPNAGADDVQMAPTASSLSQNYPNPFNPKTTIGYTVGGTRNQASGVSEVRLSVYDILGREVAMLVNEKKAPGSYGVEFDGSKLASGVYVYRLSAGRFIECRKMVLMK